MRALAREVAFKKVYESLFSESQDDDLQDFFALAKLTKQEDKEFATTIVNLYFENKQKIEDEINSRLVDYSPERIYRIDRAIISIAITEMLFYKQTPVKVVINEAVELAKKYGTDKSYAFVNGLLKSVSEANC